jgi:hypothetical protein
LQAEPRKASSPSGSGDRFEVLPVVVLRLVQQLSETRKIVSNEKPGSAPITDAIRKMQKVNFVQIEIIELIV